MMDITGIGAIVGLGRDILDKIFPDPAQRADAELKLLQAHQEGLFKEMDDDLQRSLAQTNINAAEATNPSLFVSGWRPAVGWVCVAALAYQYLFRPLAPVFYNALGHPIPDFPGLDDGLYQLVFLLLGFGGIRSFDKLKGVARV